MKKHLIRLTVAGSLALCLVLTNAAAMAFSHGSAKDGSAGGTMGTTGAFVSNQTDDVITSRLDSLHPEALQPEPSVTGVEHDSLLDSRETNYQNKKKRLQGR